VRTAELGPSVGFPNQGVLTDASRLADTGEGFIRAKRGEDTRWGTPLLVSAIERAAGMVRGEHPGLFPLVVGDLSARHGGKHPLHGSHRTGRDADILFYVVDGQGRSVRGRGFYAFDERGVSKDATDELSELVYFDTARNWALVRALLSDPEAPVQWIFCAAPIKQRLLEYGAQHEPDRSLLLRAAYVLHQPSYGNPHADHFHVRLACTARESARGCLDPGPVWPWLRNEHEKPLWEGGRLDDATLVSALLE
jgi:penicillin-insensitive murein endopeptidase